MKLHTKSYKELREFLDTVPVIDTHEHYAGAIKPIDNVFKHIMGYFWADLASAAFGMEKQALSAINDPGLLLESRYETFEKLYHKSHHTAYAQAMRLGLKECWGINEINLKSFAELEDNYKNLHQQFYDDLIQRFGIKAQISDMFFDVKQLIEGKDKEYSDICKFAFALPSLHHLHNYLDLFRLEEYVDHKITCLEDYLESIENYLIKAIQFGVICFKDQSAYRRTLDYRYPTREEAEKIFNSMIYNPRHVVGSPEAKLLDDWLFHYFMRLARKYDLPVQLHTGHMAGIRNDIVKTNASHFIPVMDLHSEVKFDLFHGNWPYLDEYLFIGKNYPNAYINLCWVQSIDPLYSVELLKRAVMTIPHSKIFAYGGDTRTIELTVGYLIMARDNVACALSELVECSWINMPEARQLAVDWFFNNPNDFYSLGFERITV